MSATFIGTVWFIPWVPLLLLGHPVTVTQWDKKRGERQVVVGPGEKSWISGKSISKHVLYAIVVAEDARFFEHHGLDFREIHESYQLNLKRKRFARGASTITQQVVKMAFLTREKTIIRKAREAVGAVLLDGIASKDEILEWYLNLAEFGDGIYGIKAAAAHYFSTKPELLTIEQAVHLALVIPSPNTWSKGLRQKNLTKFGERRFAAIVRNMKLSGYITEGQWQTALSRGNFGRPVAGYEGILAAAKKVDVLCSPSNLAACADQTASLWEDVGEEEEKEKDKEVSRSETAPAPTSGAPSPHPSPDALSTALPSSPLPAPATNSPSAPQAGGTPSL